jgi:Dolichyl-phosphate-mannose-protein mannosyltransferase
MDDEFYQKDTKPLAESEDLEAVAVSPRHGDARHRCKTERSLSDRFAVVAIVSGWVALAAIVNPIGEVILNDDGAYSYAVKSVLETGSLRFSPWGSPNLFSQVYWGALFCLPFGFTYTALRLSTLTIALAGLLALYGLLREAGARSTTALFGVLLLALNPLFFELSFTFMTDVPFLGFTLVAMYLLVRGARRQSRMEFVLGLLAATAALLTRQTGLALFFALSLSCLVKNGLSKRNAIKAAAPALLGLGVQFSYQTWVKMTGRMTLLFGKPAMDILNFKSMSISFAMKHIASGVVFTLSYLGLFMLPLLLFIGYDRLRDLWRQQRWIAILTSVVLIVAGAVPLLHHHRMPFVSNVLYDMGLGPAMVRDDFHTLPSAGPVFWTVVTVISLFAAALVLQVLISACLLLVRTRGQHQELLLMVVATGLIYFLPLPFVATLYDRYFLLFVPLATVVLFMIGSRDNAPSRRWTALAVLCLLTYGAFSVAGTHDFLAWNRTRWQVLRTLTVARHIRPEQIDGGYEFNCTYRSPVQRKSAVGNNLDISFIPHVGDDLVVSFGPATGYAEAERYTFRRWLSPGEGTILVLRKNSSDPISRPVGNSQ